MDTTHPDKTLSPAAVRMRRHRERRRSGQRSVTIVLHEREIDELVRGGLLPLDRRNDTGSVVEAVHAFLDKAFPAPSDV